MTLTLMPLNYYVNKTDQDCPAYKQGQNKPGIEIVLKNTWVEDIPKVILRNTKPILSTTSSKDERI